MDNEEKGLLVLEVGTWVKLRNGAQAKVVEFEPDFAYPIGLRLITDEKGETLPCLQFISCAPNGRFTASGKSNYDIVAYLK